MGSILEGMITKVHYCKPIYSLIRIYLFHENILSSVYQSANFSKISLDYYMIGCCANCQINAALIRDN